MINLKASVAKSYTVREGAVIHIRNIGQSPYLARRALRLDCRTMELSSLNTTRHGWSQTGPTVSENVV